MLEKLEMLSIEALIKLRDSVNAVLSNKTDKMLRVGQIAYFEPSDGGDRTYIVITKVNPKTFSGYRYDINTGAHERNLRWKVGKRLLTPHIEPKKPEPKPFGIGHDRPAQQAVW